KLVTVHEVRMSNLLYLGNPTLDKATRYLWALRRGVLSPSFQVSQAPRPSPEQCGELLRDYGPKLENGASALGTSPVLVVYFARIVCQTFESALRGLQNFGRNTQASQRLMEKLCDFAGQLAARHLLQKSFLPEQAQMLDLPTDQGHCLKEGSHPIGLVAF
ncbi:unnamed protein product, partial [Symbiodinium sp. CCMP2456]